MKTKKFRYLVLASLSLFIYTQSFAQEKYVSDVQKSKLIVTGTSTVHDWEMEVESFDCDATISTDGNKLSEISNINLTCPVENLKSHNKIMDNKAYKALKSDKNPKITFQLKDTDAAANQSVKGTLNMNNISKEVEIKFTTESVTENQIKVKGEVPLKMSDFNIDPPTAMMGTLKTGDDIKISYEILFNKTK